MITLRCGGQEDPSQKHNSPKQKRKTSLKRSAESLQKVCRKPPHALKTAFCVLDFLPLGVFISKLDVIPSVRGILFSACMS